MQICCVHRCTALKVGTRCAESMKGLRMDKLRRFPELHFTYEATQAYTSLSPYFLRMSSVCVW